MHSINKRRLDFAHVTKIICANWIWYIFWLLRKSFHDIIDCIWWFKSTFMPTKINDVYCLILLSYPYNILEHSHSACSHRQPQSPQFKSADTILPPINIWIVYIATDSFKPIPEHYHSAYLRTTKSPHLKLRNPVLPSPKWYLHVFQVKFTMLQKLTKVFLGILFLHPRYLYPLMCILEITLL